MSFRTADAPGRAPFHESRNLAFAAADSKTERGRAIALVLAELLRESPAAALMVAHPPGAVEASASHLTLAGLFAAERTLPGSWGLGPEVMVGFGVTEAFWVRGRGRALFGSADFQYQATNDGSHEDRDDNGPIQQHRRRAGSGVDVSAFGDAIDTALELD
jgi:hypothetical protein